MDSMLSEPHNTFTTIRLLVPNHYTARYFYLPVLHLDRNTSHGQVTDNKMIIVLHCTTLPWSTRVSVQLNNCYMDKVIL